MGRTYTLVNQKGGVGKTTTVINLGAYLAYFGQRVLLIDLDPQANATSCLGVEKQTIRGGTYEALIGTTPAANHILHNPRFKISILPASTSWPPAIPRTRNTPSPNRRTRRKPSSGSPC